MRLSIIILNYNVQLLLEQCLQSVIQSIKTIDAEIIVIDNNSQDDSVYMVRTKYPQAKLLINTENKGFAKAYNEGVKTANGEYILILNPDTIVNESAILHSLKCLEKDSTIGIVGVKMINQEGRYLQESKRGFPSLGASIFRLTGINLLFSKSKIFNQYYLGHLDENKIHEVKALTGAYMMMPRTLYQACGGFDEKYFMYGEDLDLSNTVLKQGKKLIYLGTETIVHLKGRSSRGDSYQHVKNFYQAMSVYVHKQYEQSFAKWMLQLGITLAGILSFMKRKIINRFLPITDIFILVFSIWVSQFVWAHFWFKQNDYFHNKIFLLNGAIYFIIWQSALLFFNSYNNFKSKDVLTLWKSIGWGTLLILLVYALMPEHLRSSRAVILLSTVVISILLPMARSVMASGYSGYSVLFVSEEASMNRYQSLLTYWQSHQKISFIQVKPLHEALMVKTNHKNITHILFDKDVFTIEDKLKLYKQFGAKLDFLSINENGLADGTLRLAKKRYQLQKFLFHIIICIVLLPWAWIRKDVRTSIGRLIAGSLHWVGYKPGVNPLLPYRKEGLWYLDDLPGTTDQINFQYAMNYSPWLDIKICIDHLFNSKL